MKYSTVFRQALLTFGMVCSTWVCGHTSYPVKVKCPLDGKSFTIDVTGSYTTFNTLKDFQKQGAIGDLYESMVNACPLCHYSGYKDDFDKKFTQDTIQELLTILDPYKNSLMSDVLENEIAVKIAQYLKRDNDYIANLYLVASYFLKRDSSQMAKRKELQTNAAIYFCKAIDNKEYDYKPTYATIHYLVGELYRRTGDFENAVKYYDCALNDPDKKDWLQEVATKQKELAIKKDEDNSI